MLDVNSDWPQLGFNARGGRNNSGENILTSKTVSGLALAWQSAINDMVSSPAVANGILYVGTRDGHLLALDAATGAQRWSAATAASIVSSPTVSDGTVYVTSNDHKLYAFDAATGAQRWASLTDYSISSSPVAANGLVYVVADSGTLFAFKTRNGILAWQAAHDYLWPGSTPAVAGGLVYAMSSQNYVFAFDGASGKPIWAGGYMHAGNNAGSPAVSDGAVYMPTDGSLGAFDATSGQTLWQSGVGPGSASLALSKGSVFMATIDHVVWNFNATTGALVSDTLEATAMESTPAAAHRRALCRRRQRHDLGLSGQDQQAPVVGVDGAGGDRRRADGGERQALCRDDGRQPLRLRAQRRRRHRLQERRRAAAIREAALELAAIGAQLSSPALRGRMNYQLDIAKSRSRSRRRG